MSSVTGANVTFSFEYAVSLIVVLVVCHTMFKKNPAIHPLGLIAAGLVVGFIVLYVLNKYFPALNKTAKDMYSYFVFQYMSNFNSMGYTHIWPPLLAVFVLFVILLYGGRLG